MDKRSFSEHNICTKFITPVLRSAGWDEMLQIRGSFGCFEKPGARRHPVVANRNVLADQTILGPIVPCIREN